MTWQELIELCDELLELEEGSDMPYGKLSQIGILFPPAGATQHGDIVLLSGPSVDRIHNAVKVRQAEFAICKCFEDTFKSPGTANFYPVGDSQGGMP